MDCSIYLIQLCEQEWWQSHKAHHFHSRSVNSAPTWGGNPLKRHNSSFWSTHTAKAFCKFCQRVRQCMQIYLIAIILLFLMMLGTKKEVTFYKTRAGKNLSWSLGWFTAIMANCCNACSLAVYLFTWMKGLPDSTALQQLQINNTHLLTSSKWCAVFVISDVTNLSFFP